MFGMSFMEIMFILAIALIVIGPEKLPKVAKSLGRTFGEFRKATGDIRQSFDLGNDANLDNISKAFESSPKTPEKTVAGPGDAPPVGETDIPLPEASPDIKDQTPPEATEKTALKTDKTDTTDIADGSKEPKESSDA